ncbi:MAG: hypothetical protein LBD77_05095 [Bifidobacteriaceae bacterium]|nr:hypothetical protein [Bifidobacteriaceae bacterium]
MIRTVLGDISPEALGPCDYHEHLFQRSPLLAGDELCDEQLSGREAAAMAEAGIGAMVEATATGLGRRPAAVARIAAGAGLRIVHATGAHHSGHYGDGHWLMELGEAELAARFTADVVEGLPSRDEPSRGAASGGAQSGGAQSGGAQSGGAASGGAVAGGALALGPGGQPVRAGLVKAAAQYWRIGPFERRVLAAAAQTALATGVPVMVHLDHGSASFEVLDRLAADGVQADRVVLAHIDRNLDPGLHAELAQAGAYLGYDGMARHRQAPDSALIDCLERALAAGAPLDRFLLGADVARSSRFVAYGGMPGLEYLPRRFLPRLAARLGRAATQRLMIDNPARLLSLR